MYYFIEKSAINLSLWVYNKAERRRGSITLSLCPHTTSMLFRRVVFARWLAIVFATNWLYWSDWSRAVWIDWPDPVGHCEGLYCPSIALAIVRRGQLTIVECEHLAIVRLGHSFIIKYGHLIVIRSLYLTIRGHERSFIINLDTWPS